MMSQSEHDDDINAMQIQREHDKVMPASSPGDVNHDDVVLMRCKH